VKKLFLVFLVLLVGIAGLSAAPPRPGGADNVPQMIIPRVDSTVSIAPPGMPEPMRSGGIFVAQGKKTAFTETTAVICLWFDQYREGLLTGDEFKTLVAGRIAVIYMIEQTVYLTPRIANLTLPDFPLRC
jgi:hypothetical protein